MKYLVTGGAGFIGSHIVRRLIKDGHQAVILDDFSNSSKENVASEAILIEGSVTNKEKLTEALQGCDGVFHLAAEVSVPKSMAHPQETLDTNAFGTLLLLETMKDMGVRKIVFSGTSAVYGDRGNKVNTEDMKPKPLSPYAYSKLLSEYYIKTFTHLYDFESVIFRYFNVYGPGQRPDSPYAAVIPIFISRIQNKEPITIYGDGSQTRDFIHVDDVVEANMLAMRSQLKAEVINIGSGESINLLDLIKELESIYQISLQPKFAPRREGDILHSIAGTKKANSLLNYRSKTPLSEGLNSCISNISHP